MKRTEIPSAISKAHEQVVLIHNIYTVHIAVVITTTVKYAHDFSIVDTVNSDAC